MKNKKQIRGVLNDGFGNYIFLLPTVCPDCLGEKGRYLDKCIRCREKMPKEPNPERSVATKMLRKTNAGNKIKNNHERNV